MPYYFEYKTSSNLRRIQCLNVCFRKKILERCTFLEFKTILNFSTGKKFINYSFYRSNTVYIQQGGQNNENTKKLRNRICVDYIERTSFGNTFSLCLHCVVLVSVHY
jgi:hypothetical protein